MSDDCPQFDESGQPYIAWAWDYFGFCAYNATDIASLFVGLSSIVFWCCAQLPQIIKNILQKHSLGLSFGFLLLWFFGDLTNLLGCYLTDQLATQKYTAIYFCLVDVILWFQYFYYNYYFPSRRRANGALNEAAAASLELDEEDHQTLSLALAEKQSDARSSLLLVMLVVWATWSVASNIDARSATRGDVSSLRKIHEQQDEEDDEEIVGLVLAWISATLYLFSRLPQIAKNILRRSVDGLSPLLFFFAVMGNVTYSMSIFLSSLEPEHLLNHLPYLVGSLGVLVFDMIILIQFWYYGDRRKRYSQIPT